MGKSNLLRALDLFFNCENIDTQFELDFSDHRKSIASSESFKGQQFFWIKVTFNTPETYTNSVGKEFYVKRQWNRHGEITETRSKNSSSPQITRILNKISFHYIKAIKDQDVFSELLSKLYQITLESDGFKETMEKFVRGLQGETLELTNLFQDQLKINTLVSSPTNIDSLFRTLDFEADDDQHSLIHQKGDGLKAKHIPRILEYLADHESSSQYHIWGFEEPENSLDLENASNEAENFARISGKDNIQLFLTSHSPVFYLKTQSKGSDSKRFFVETGSSDAKAEGGSGKIVELNSIAEAEVAMGGAGITQLPFIIRQLSIRDQNLQEIEKEITELRSELAQNQRPCLFVEGKNDVDLFVSARDRFDISTEQLEIYGLGTAQSNLPLLITEISKNSAGLHTPVLFLFDNDPSGRKAARALKQDYQPDSTPKVSYVSESWHVWTLPFSDEAESFFKDQGILEKHRTFFAEHLYNSKAGFEVLKDCFTEEKSSSMDIIEEYHQQLGQSKKFQLSQTENKRDWYFLTCSPEKSGVLR